jgi:hypothetical protein
MTNIMLSNNGKNDSKVHQTKDDDDEDCRKILFYFYFKWLNTQKKKKTQKEQQLVFDTRLIEWTLSLSLSLPYSSISIVGLNLK